MKALLARLERYWFADMPSSRLAIIRILVGSYALYYLGTRRDMLLELASSPEYLFRPVGPFRFLGGPMAPEVFAVLLYSTLVLGAGFVIGWKQRFVGPTFAVLLLLTFSYRNSWSMIYHSHNLVVIHALVLGFARSADALSLDAWRRGLPMRPQGATASHWRYGWPINLMCVLTAGTYFLAGVAKVKSELGWAWAGGLSLRDQIAVDAIRKEVFGSSGAPLAYTLYDYVWLFTLLGVGSLIIELGAPAALLRRRWGYAWVLVTISLHWGILFVMGITFRYQLSGIIFASFLPLELVLLRGRNALDHLRGRWRRSDDPRSSPVRAVDPRTS